MGAIYFRDLRIQSFEKSSTKLSKVKFTCELCYCMKAWPCRQRTKYEWRLQCLRKIKNLFEKKHAAHKNRKTGLQNYSLQFCRK